MELTINGEIVTVAGDSLTISELLKTTQKSLTNRPPPLLFLSC